MLGCSVNICRAGYSWWKPWVWSAVPRMQSSSSRSNCCKFAWYCPEYLPRCYWLCQQGPYELGVQTQRHETFIHPQSSLHSPCRPHVCNLHKVSVVDCPVLLFPWQSRLTFGKAERHDACHCEYRWNDICLHFLISSMFLEDIILNLTLLILLVSYCVLCTMLNLSFCSVFCHLCCCLYGSDHLVFPLNCPLLTLTKH